MKHISKLTQDEVTKLRNRIVDIDAYIDKVKTIVEDVKVRGDSAVLNYTEKLDGVKLSSPVLTSEMLRELASDISPDEREHIDLLIRRVIELNSRILPHNQIVIEDGQIVEFRYIPIEKVGLYVPRGYISTLIMLAAIAKVAGCREIIVVTPPLTVERPVSPHLAYAALRLNVSKLVVANGVAGIAALAFGTESIPRVYKVFGPGNMYIQAAKYLVSKYVEIDGIEGPTELVLLVGKDSPESYTNIVLDVLAELEHGRSSIAVVFSESEEFLKIVEQHYAEWSSRANLGLLYTILVDKLEDAIDLVNTIAPEHVEIYSSHARARKIARSIVNAGVISVNTPCTYMDYCAGVCHVLPTGGFARSRGCITPLDFMKIVPTCEGYLRDLIQAGITLAKLENLPLHLESLRARRQ